MKNHFFRQKLLLACVVMLPLGLMILTFLNETISFSFLAKPVRKDLNDRPISESKPRGVSSTTQDAIADSIILGTSAAFEGSSRALGIELYRGSMAYFEHINRNGGINGKQIFIQAYDDHYNPIPTIQNTIKLVEEDDVLLLFNYVGTPTVTRMLPLLNYYRDRHISLFFPFTGAQPQREYPYNQMVFNLRASYRQETEGLVNNLVSIGRKKIAVFYQMDAYGRSGWDGVRRSLSQYDLEIVEEATYRRGIDYSEDLTQQVNILRSAQPDAIVAIGSYQACAALIRDARNANWHIPIAVISFVGSESLLALLQETAGETGTDYTQNLISSQVVPSYDDLSLPTVREYRQFIKQYNPQLPLGLAANDYDFLPYSFVSFEGFLNAKLLVAILQKASENSKDYNRLDIANAAQEINNFDLGIGTPISFSPDSPQALNKVYYMTVQDGKFVSVENWQGWAK